MGSDPPYRPAGDPPSESLPEFELEIQRLRETDPERATWLAIQNLAGQTSELRHMVRSIDSRQQALRSRLLGDPDDPRDDGALGEIQAQIRSVFSFGKAVLGLAASIVVIVVGAFISGRFHFT